MKRKLARLIRIVPAWMAVWAICAQPAFGATGVCQCKSTATPETAESCNNEVAQQSECCQSSPRSSKDCCSAEPVEAAQKLCCSSKAQAADSKCCCGEAQSGCRCDDCNCGRIMPAQSLPPVIPSPNGIANSEIVLSLSLDPQETLCWADHFDLDDGRQFPHGRICCAQETCALLSRFTC